MLITVITFWTKTCKYDLLKFVNIFYKVINSRFL